MSKDDYFLIVPASGIGSRMNSSILKQYILLDNGLTVIDQTLKTLLGIDAIKGCVIAISQNDSEFKKSRFYDHHKILSISSGGKERINSVLSAMEKLVGIAKDNDWILVHDAVRPCVKSEEILLLIEQLDGNSTGGLLGVKITDTVKQIGNNAIIEKTIDRSNLWQACTPQMYRFGLLYKALIKAQIDGIGATDEASAIEHSNLKSKIIPCGKSNIKITTPQDLELANYYLRGL
jgi:2-C-methyl-D-erythritol 4-phosphate cytidylyltransferase